MTGPTVAASCVALVTGVIGLVVCVRGEAPPMVAWIGFAAALAAAWSPVWLPPVVAAMR